MPAYDAVAFDLLTALIDSWTLWNSVAGSLESGMRWRKRYLEITYGCGAYRPYQKLVQEAGVEVGLPASCAESLEARWGELTPWPEVPVVLGRLAARLPLGIATNCSERLGHLAAARAGNAFKVVITAEWAGYYKPRPEPYRALLEALGTRPQRTLFIAGSASDVPGARGVGMPVFWHNRIGLPPRDDARPEFCEASLAGLPRIVLGAD
jgi:2-haloalkanoic acid dehalogenase type II